MKCVARFVVLLLFVFVPVLEAELFIRVSYDSPGEYVSRDLRNGDTEAIQLSTEDVFYSCVGGNFTIFPPEFNKPPMLYTAINSSTFLIRIVFTNIDGLSGNTVCTNGTNNVTAKLVFKGVGLFWRVYNGSDFEYHRLPPGGSVLINNQSKYILECLSAFSDNSSAAQLFRPNGTQFTLFPNLESGPPNTIHAVYIPWGVLFQLDDDFTNEEQGQYRCVLLNSDSQPENFTFVLYSGSPPCNLSACPEFSECNASSTTNLCQCESPLEYRSAKCQCPVGFSLNDTNPPLNCTDSNECQLQPTICGHFSPNASCLNTIGGYQCQCPTDQSIVGERCEHPCDILDCSLLSNRTCQRNATGNYSCECISGYIAINDSHCSPFSPSISHSIAPTMSLAMSSSIYSTVSAVFPSPMPSSSISHSIAPTMSPTSSSSIYSTVSAVFPSPMPSSSISHSFTPTMSLAMSSSISITQPTTAPGPIKNVILQIAEINRSLTNEETDMFLGIIESSLPTDSAPENFSSAASALLQITQKLDNLSDSQARSFVELLGRIASPGVLRDISNDESTDVVKVVSDIIETAENIAKLLAPLYYNNDTVIDNANIRLEVKTVPTDGSIVQIGGETIAKFSFDSSIFTCKQNCSCNSTCNSTADCQTVAVTIELKNINNHIPTNFTGFQSWFCSEVEMEVLNNSGINQSVNTNVFSFSLASLNCDINTSNLSQPIRISFPIQNTDLASPSCVALIPGDNKTTQDESSCERVPSANGSVLTCSCSHLTSFAILMSPDPSFQSSLPMDITSYVCLSVSILSLFIGLFIYTFVRFKVSFAIFFVHYNLMVSVLVSEIVFVVGIDRSEYNELCLIVAVVLHYVLLVSFLWMFFEVFNLVVLVLRPSIKQKRIIHLYWPLAYGLPLIVAAVSLGISHCDYGSYRGVSFPEPMSTNCWLPRLNGRYWAFIGPSLFIILVNTVQILFLSGRLIQIRWKRMGYRASSLQSSKSRTLAEGFISAIRGSMLLMPIVGFTWIFGIFAINSAGVVFQWLFIIFNGLQGFFIFLFYCVLKTEVRDAFLLLLLRKVFRREIRLGEGETLFSTMKRKSSFFSESRSVARELTDSRNSKTDINLISLSPAKRQTAFVNPINQK